MALVLDSEGGVPDFGQRSNRVLVPAFGTTPDGRSAESRRAKSRVDLTARLRDVRARMAMLNPRDPEYQALAAEADALERQVAVAVPSFGQQVEQFRTLAMRPLETPEAIEKYPGFLQPFGRAAREFTSPAQIAATVLMAGAGPSVAGALRGGTGLARVVRGGAAALAAPVLERGPFASRLAAEAGLGVAATAGGQEVARHIPETAPWLVRFGAPLVGGLAAGGGALVAGRMVPLLGRAVGREFAASYRAAPEAGFARIPGGPPENMQTVANIDKQLARLGEAKKLVTHEEGIFRHADIDEELEHLSRLRRDVLQTELTESQWARLQEVEEEMRQAQATKEGLEETIRDSPLRPWYNRLVSKTGKNAGEVVPDSALKKYHYSGYDDLATELGYEKRINEAERSGQKFVIASDEALKEDLRRMYRDYGKLARAKADLRSLDAEWRGLNKGAQPPAAMPEVPTQAGLFGAGKLAFKADVGQQAPLGMAPGTLPVEPTMGGQMQRQAQEAAMVAATGRREPLGIKPPSPIAAKVAEVAPSPAQAPEAGGPIAPAVRRLSDAEERDLLYLRRDIQEVAEMGPGRKVKPLEARTPEQRLEQIEEATGDLADANEALAEAIRDEADADTLAPLRDAVVQSRDALRIAQRKITPITAKQQAEWRAREDTFSVMYGPTEAEVARAKARLPELRARLAELEAAKAQPPSPIAAEAPKQPWEMTRNAYVLQELGGRHTPPPLPQVRDPYGFLRLKDVQAIQDGWAIVASRYPRLAAKVKVIQSPSGITEGYLSSDGLLVIPPNMLSYGAPRVSLVMEHELTHAAQNRVTRGAVTNLTPGGETIPTKRGIAREDQVRDWFQRNPHKEAVAQALAEGKPVPPEVLKDYPDLGLLRQVGPGSAQPPIGPAVPSVASPAQVVQPPRPAAEVPTGIPGAAGQVTAPSAAAQPPPLPSGAGAPRPAAGKAQKQLWEMTFEEFEDYVSGPNPIEIRDVLQARKFAIKQALAEGKPVPHEVLADYPELVRPRAARAAAPVAPPVEPPKPPVAQAVAPVKESAKAETDTVVALASGQQAQVPLPTSTDEFIRAADPSGPVPPLRKPPAPPGGPPPVGEPDEIFQTIARQATGGEQPSETILRRYGGAMTTAENEARLALDAGNRILKQAGIGQSYRGRLVPRQQDLPGLDSLFEALHNPSKVASGEMQVPTALRGVFEDLRRLTDWEEAMRLDFDPTMATVEDYFYRGWLVPKGAGRVPRGSLASTPAFKKPRVGATYREMRDAGFEPISWNPYEQWRIARLQGVRYRQQMELVQALKKMELAVTDAAGKGIEGWRTPRVGSAFEGKVFATVNGAGEPVAMYSRRWLVPDALANRLEGLYGTPISLGNVTVANRSVDLMKAIDVVTFLPKRLKLFGSLFQQMDFLSRSYSGAWTGMVDALRAGKPVEAVNHLAIWPKSAVKIVEANFRPGARNAIRQQLNSTQPIIAGRPGIHLRGIMEAGLSTVDTTILPANLDSTARVVAEESRLMGNAAVRRAIGSMESAMRRGLFEGTYPAAQITDIKNNIAPILVRRYGNMTDEALNGMIARVANKKYSTIPVTQSVIQNRYLREILKRLFFSISESEGLIRQATGAIRGPEAGYWRTHWIGAYLGLAALANAIHFASTGQPLPGVRYVPLSRDRDGPLPLGYNQKFMAPDIPLKGKEGLNLTVDLVGQMDTALRILDPISFLNSRESVPIRALTTQLSERDYFGRPIDQVGPGGIYSRTANLINDLFTPIGVGQAAVQIGLEKGGIPEKLLPASEKGLGISGQLVQVTGMNLRAQYLRNEWASDLQPYSEIPDNKQEREAKLKAATTREERLRYLYNRDQYRTRNPAVDAKLFLTGQVETLKTLAARHQVVQMMRQYNLQPEQIRGLEQRQYETPERRALRLWILERMDKGRPTWKPKSMFGPTGPNITPGAPGWKPKSMFEAAR